MGKLPYLTIALLSPHVTRVHYTRGPSTYDPRHVAPLTGIRVARLRGSLPRVSAACAPRGPLGLCHVASAPRRTLRQSRVPRQPPPRPTRHVSIRRLWTKIPPFFVI